MINPLDPLEGKICAGCGQAVTEQELLAGGVGMTPSGIMHRDCTAGAQKSYIVHWRDTVNGKVMGGGEYYEQARSNEHARELARLQLSHIPPSRLTVSPHRAYGQIKHSLIEATPPDMTNQDLVDLRRLIASEMARRG